jgi:small subunit ribosomal protein S8
MKARYPELRSLHGNSMISDPIGDMLIRIKNAGRVSKPHATFPYSRIKHAIAHVLVREGYLAGVEKDGRKSAKLLEVALKYTDKKSAIHGVKRISKPSRRLYTTARDIKPVLHGAGTLVLSTPKGILTGKEAKSGNVGGEILFLIY